MSDSKPSKVFMFDGGDPEMQGASEKARSTFKYFWRELAWEGRRIIPGLQLACVKAPFSDAKRGSASPGDPQVEHMWLNDIDFDGRRIKGVLLNHPNWLKTVRKGDTVRLPIGELGDWMYAIGGEVYGAFTVNLMRSRMEARERGQHDAAWGLNFGDATKVRIVPAPKKSGGMFKGWFGREEQAEIQEHPMSQNMAGPFREQLTKDPAMVNAKDDRGWTLLHHQSLAGSLATVSVLLECGAKVNAVNNRGMTPLQLARSLAWDKVIALLESRGAR